VRRLKNTNWDSLSGRDGVVTALDQNAPSEESDRSRYNFVSARESIRPIPDHRWPSLSEPDLASATRSERQGASPGISVSEFVGSKFLPEYIESKSLAGRTHYQSMLKHILRPDTVDRLLNPGMAQRKSRLKAIPGWPYLDNVQLCQLREQHVRDLTEAAFAQGYSAQTVTHIRNVLGLIVVHAKRERLFADENPVSGVELPPICHKKPQDLTIAQAMAMLKMMRYPEREIALIAITTGISVQEICGLQWKHVNLTTAGADCDEETIPSGSILLKHHWNSEGIVQLHSSRIRLIKVPEPLSAILLRLKHEALSADPNAFVLATPSGAPIRPASLRMTRLKVIGRKIAAPWLSWQVVKRAHDAMLSELRIQLNSDLVSSAQ
jgi:integrase